MTTFYGGRSEVRIRKNPIQVAYMDVLSMYPTVCTLQDMGKFVICDHVGQEEYTEQTKKILDEIDLERLTDQSLWKELQILCLIEPDDDILPIRSKYGDKHTFNIGLNHLTSETPIWYSIFDVIASKLHTGRSPKILQAIKFKPVGVQAGLTQINILDNIDFDPTNDDFFRRMIELRKGVKDELNEQLHNGIDDEYTDQLRSKEHIIKIITNSTSYGIFVQLDSERLSEEKDFDVFGLDQFTVSKRKTEKFGQMFNPIIGTFITSASRLILAITERILMDHGEAYAFCDTDSMAVPNERKEEIQDYFRNLNPYSFDAEIFELEKENRNPETGELETLRFFGISSKRYVLFNIRNGKRIIRKYSLHGLGHILNPFHTDINWQEKVWQDILDIHFDPDRLPEIMEEYRNRYAVSQLTISTPDILRRFDDMNQDLPLDQRIKPFNFALVGTSVLIDEKTGKPIKPIVPFSRTPWKAPYGPFKDFKSERTYQGTEYWQSMDNVLSEYINHPESKFEGDKGVLTRKHVMVHRIVYIGKESDKVDETSVLGVGSDGYSVYQSDEDRLDYYKKIIFGISYDEAEKLGFDKKNWREYRKMLREGRVPKFHLRIINILSKYYQSI